MREIQKRFLAEFDQPLRKHIINFCNTISETEYDVYLLMARKAACFTDVLIEIGLLKLNGKIVTDRVLEYDTNWLEGKKIAIIDDTIISGTSIYKLIEKLKLISATKIDVFTFCINEYWFVDEMLSLDDGSNFLKKPYLRLDHTTSLRFCKHIVDSLALTPRPYNVDFPIYNKIKFKRRDFNRIFESTLWKAVNTTNGYQKNNEIECISLNPNKEFLKSFNNDLGWEIDKSAHFKLRLYSKKLTDSKGDITYISKVVPFILFNAISHENVIHLTDEICNLENIDSKVFNSLLKTEVSKLLFVQYYFSARLFKKWLNFIETLLDKKIIYNVNNRSLNFLFSPEILEVINNFKLEGNVKLNFKKYTFLSESIEVNKIEHPINPIKTLNSIISPFLDLYYQKELPARRIVQKLKKKAFENIEYLHIVNRLYDGISLTQLKNEVSRTVSNRSDINLIISLFLDNYVDNGIVVPITVNKNGVLYRGYRHGEEVVWGNNNNKLLAKFYEKYLNVIGAEDLSNIYFQKLLVIFLKIGIREGFLEEYSSITPKNLRLKLLSVKAHLFGQISVYSEVPPFQSVNFTPILDYDTKAYWTSEFFKDLGILKFNGSNNIVFDFEKFNIKHAALQNRDEPEDIDETDTDKVHEIAEIFGFLKSNKLIDEDALVLLTSCLSLHDNTSSIAAELQIFLKSYPSYKNRIQSHINTTSFTLDRLKKLRLLKENLVWPALNSGQYKYVSYKNGKGRKLIQVVTEHFQSTKDSFKERAWKKFWKSEFELSKNEINELEPINNKMGVLLLELHIMVNAIHVLVFELISRSDNLTVFENRVEKEKLEIRQGLNKITEELKKLKIKDGDLSGNQIETNNLLTKTLGNQRKKLRKRSKKLSKDLKYWKTFNDENIADITKKAKELEQLNFEYKCDYVLNQILLGTYTEMKSKSLANLIHRIIKTLDESVLEIKSILKDFKTVVPKWGKIQEKQIYISLIHINSEIQDLEERKKISIIIKKHLLDFEISEFGENRRNKSFNLLRVADAKSGDGYIIGGRGQFTFERMTKLSCYLLEEFIRNDIPVTISFYPYFCEDGVHAYYNPQNLNYDIVKERLFLTLENNITKNEIIVYFSKQKYSVEGIERVLHSNFENKFNIDLISERNDLLNMASIKLTNEQMSSFKSIGIVTAIPKELAAIRLMLDIEIPLLKQPENDENDYIIGLINSERGEKIKVIIALMKEYGTNNAASTTSNLLRSFDEVEDVIITGIAGGIPNIKDAENHVRLGDIVVSDKNGILQYDSLKETSTNVKIRDYSSKPSARLLGKVNLLKSEYEQKLIPWLEILKNSEGELRNSKRPQEKDDILTIGKQIVAHPVDIEREPNIPRVHYGAIGSSNTLLKNEQKRDYLRDNYGVKAIEMEASGIADGTWNLSKGYLIVRGIVDYCNEDKNDLWHNYAALCAASYTKAIIKKL